MQPAGGLGAERRPPVLDGQGAIAAHMGGAHAVFITSRHERPTCARRMSNRLWRATGALQRIRTVAAGQKRDGHVE